MLVPSPFGRSVFPAWGWRQRMRVALDARRGLTFLNGATGGARDV